MPAAFLHDYGSSTTRMLIAPKMLPSESEQTRVRVSPPDSDGITRTRTVVFNKTLTVEYLDGQTKQLHQERLEREAAFCVQLLRLAFEPACWHALD